MARSGSQDPIERFRYKVTVIEDILASQGFDLAKAIKGETQPAQMSGGFSEIVLPKGEVGTISYRENIHANRFIKKPGLTRYDPITFKKGVTKNQDLYNWYKLVNNDAIGFSVTAEVVGNGLQIPPVYPDNFRKDLVITAMDREGTAIKSWVVLDAFPISYKGGNDLDASVSEKLISELGIAFEAMVEITGSNIQSLTEEADQAAKNASVVAALGLTLSGGKSGGGLL